MRRVGGRRGNPGQNARELVGLRLVGDGGGVLQKVLVLETP